MESKDGNYLFYGDKAGKTSTWYGMFFKGGEKNEAGSVMIIYGVVYWP